MKDRYDIVIAGAGPAGSATAIRLAIAGLSVALVEKTQFPREKLCGEFISPECLAHFRELGVAPAMTLAGGVDINKTVFYARGGRSVAVDSDWFGAGKAALGLSRAEMDMLLLERAREVGVNVIENAGVGAPVLEQQRIVGVRFGKGRVLRGNIFIDATGRGRAIAKHFENGRVEKPSRVAFKAHFSNALIEPGACEIYAYRGGYGGCNAVENELYNLCFIASAKDVRDHDSDPRSVMDGIVLANKRASEVLTIATQETDWLAVPITRFGRSSLAPVAGLLTVGDAASFIDPFTGSGILMALESSKIAATAIIENRERAFGHLSTAYEKAYSRTFDNRFGITGLVRRVAFIPSFAGATISLLSLSPSLPRKLARATRSEAFR